MTVQLPSANASPLKLNIVAENGNHIIALTLPFHLRYSYPGNGSVAQVNVNPPVLDFACNPAKETKYIHVSCESVLHDAHDQKASPTIISIPIGRQLHLALTELLTGIAIWLAALVTAGRLCAIRKAHSN